VLYKFESSGKKNIGRQEEQLYHLFFSACHFFEGIVDHCCTTVIRNIVNTSPRAQYRRLKSNEAK
jgi:hypothetical protein